MFEKDKKLKIFIPVAIFAVIAIAAFFLYGSYMEIVNERMYEELFNAYGGGFVQWYKEFTAGSATFTSAIAAVTLFLTPFVTTLYASVIIKVVCGIIYKSEMKFMEIYAPVLYTDIVTVVGALLTILMSILLSSPANVFAFSAFMTYDPSSFIYTFLSGITIFSVIQYVLLYMIIKARSGLDGSKVIQSFVIIVVLMTVVGAALATLGAGDQTERMKPVYEMYINSQG